MPALILRCCFCCRSVFDKRLLTDFWSSSTERRRVRLLLPDLADCCLVFHRGIEEVTATGLYINEKIDLLLSYVVLEPVLKAGHTWWCGVVR